MRPNRLNAALSGSRQATDSLEVLLASPILRKDREREANCSRDRHVWVIRFYLFLG